MPTNPQIKLCSARRVGPDQFRRDLKTHLFEWHCVSFSALAVFSRNALYKSTFYLLTYLLKRFTNDWKLEDLDWYGGLCWCDCHLFLEVFPSTQRQIQNVVQTPKLSSCFIIACHAAFGSDTVAGSSGTARKGLGGCPVPSSLYQM